MARSTHKNPYSDVGRRGPLRTQHRPDVSIREMAYWHPDSVWESLLNNVNWLGKLRISPLAKRLSRLRGRHFLMAVESILTSHESSRHDNPGTGIDQRAVRQAG